MPFAFGEIGLMPEQFYRLTWHQYLIKCKGYTNKIDKEHEVIRFAAYNIIRPHVAKKDMPSIERFWPLRTDKTLSPEDMANKIKQRLIAAGKKFN